MLRKTAKMTDCNRKIHAGQKHKTRTAKEAAKGREIEKEAVGSWRNEQRHRYLHHHQSCPTNHS